jgi:flagellar biosynthesis/type III secretory pathway chaperone
MVVELIDHERGVCADLEAVLQAEREALTAFSAGAVAGCVRRKDALQSELALLVQERRRAVRALAGELGVEADDGRVVPLLPHLPEPVARRLREAVTRLRQSLVRTRRLQRVNGALIDASLRLVGDLVQVYRQLLPGTQYDGRAVIRPGPARETLDQRA